MRRVILAGLLERLELVFVDEQDEVRLVQNLDVGVLVLPSASSILGRDWLLVVQVGRLAVERKLRREHAELSIHRCQIDGVRAPEATSNLGHLGVTLAEVCESLVHPSQLLFGNAHVINVTGKRGVVKSFTVEVAQAG